MENIAKIQCLIIDDEPIAHTILGNFIGKDERLNLVGNCNSAMQALQILQSKKSIDLLFLDIKMPNISGLEFLRSLRNPPHVIMTTANREYALESFDLNVVDYLLKPFSFDRFLQAVNKVMLLHQAQVQNNIHTVATTATNTELNSETSMVVKVDGMLVKIHFHDILYIEAWKEYVKIYTTDKMYITLMSLSSIAEKLPNPTFYRTHRSYIVNLEKIEAVEGNTIKLKQHEVPLSRSEREAFLERFGSK